MKQLYGYTYLRKGSEEGERKGDGIGLTIMALSLIGILINFNFIAWVIIFGLVFLISIYLAFFQRETINYVEYINSNGKIKRIYEKDWGKKNEKSGKR